MPQNYKILGQVFVTPNTLTNVYVTGASTSAVVNSIYVTNQGGFAANVEIVLRPVNEALQNKHSIIRQEVVPGASTLVLNLGITMGSNTIIAANTTYAANLSPAVGGMSNTSYSAFGLEIT
jgi:acetyltransferase-like isoleucine patch superfamily enzyme